MYLNFVNDQIVGKPQQLPNCYECISNFDCLEKNDLQALKDLSKYGLPGHKWLKVKDISDPINHILYEKYDSDFFSFKIIGDVGFPIAAALIGGVFVYFVINYILESVVKAIKGMQGIIMGLDNRVKTMNHDIIRVDAVVSSALGLKPDLDRIARADGKNDARKD